MTLLEMLQAFAEPGSRAQQAAAAELTALVGKMTPRTVDDATREDVIQDVLVQVLTRCRDGGFEMQGEGQARFYLRKMARSRLVDFLRRSGREVPREIEEPSGDDPEEVEGAGDLGRAWQALEEAVGRAVESRRPRWRPPLIEAYEQAKELCSTGRTAEELLEASGALSPEAAKTERVKARYRLHQAQTRLREAVLTVADEMAKEGEREKAELVRLACAHLLRRKACQKQPSADVPGSVGGTR